MATITKKELIDRIADGTGGRRVQVKKVIQQFLDEIVSELGKGNRLEFRDFGVFETKVRKARKATRVRLEPTVRTAQTGQRDQRARMVPMGRTVSPRQ